MSIQRTGFERDETEDVTTRIKGKISLDGCVAAIKGTIFQITNEPVSYQPLKVSTTKNTLTVSDL